MNSFTCDLCKQTFDKDPGWTDSDANDECEKLYGFVPTNTDKAVLCDDCHKHVSKWFKMSQN